jgi:hypothetical protein
MNLNAVRSRCEARLRELALDIPVPFDLRAFCNAVARRRGRSIVLCPVAGQAGPCGLWVALPTADFIFYERDTGPLHQQHIILHEVGHLLCNHKAAISEAEALGLLLPDVPKQLVRDVLQRGAYSAEQDQEAEMFASLILERSVAAQLGQARAAAEDSDEAAGVLRRLATSLEEPEPTATIAGGRVRAA